MPRIFLSYRRDDTNHQAGRLTTSLAHHFGIEQIFRDKVSIPGGVNWREEVRETLTGDMIVLALIGEKWVTATDATGRRLIDNPSNNNRLELEAALRLKLKTIPVLIDDAEVPKEHELPESLRELLTINALRLRDGDWDSDAQKVIDTLEERGARGLAGSPKGRRRWLSGPILWLAALAFVALGAAALNKYTTKLQPSPTPPDRIVEPPTPPVNNAPSFQIIVDRSKAMSVPFAGTTKLEAAKKALVRLLQEKTADTDNLSLREFGGKCNDSGSTRLVLPFAPGEARLIQEVNGLTTADGDSTFVSAVIEATGDFSGRSGRSSGIIVISGGYDGCGHEDPAGAIRERLKRYPELTFDLRFIGVALSKQAQSSLSGLAQKTGGTFRNARTPTELDDAVRQAIIVEAKVGEVQVAVGILTESTNHLNDAVLKHLQRLDYNTAEREVSEAEQALGRTVVPAPEAQHPEGVRRLLDLARQAVDDQKKLLDATKSLIAAKKSGDAAAESQARGAYNSAAAAYGDKANQIDNLRKTLLSN